jgi:hypothetical protein
VGDDATILMRGLIGAAGGAGSMLLILLPWYRRLTPRTFDWIVWLLALLSRVGVFIGFFFILGNDIVEDVVVYVREGRQVLDGLLVYNDIKTSYSPLFPYCIAGILTLWSSGKAAVLASIIIELIGLPVWVKAARQIFPDHAVRLASLLYVTSPLVIINVALKGHNQVWVALFLGIGVWYVLRQRSYLSGLWLGVSIAAVKILGLLFAPILWLYAPHRIRWMIGFALIPVLTYGIFIAFGLDVLVPLKIQGIHTTSSNLPFLLTLFGLDLNEPTLNRMLTALTALSLVVIFLYVWMRGVQHKPQNIMHLITLVMLTTLLMSKKSYSNYLMMCYLPLCLSIITRPLTWKVLLWLGLFYITGSVAASMFNRWILPSESNLSMLWDGTLQYSGTVASNSTEAIAAWRGWTFAVTDTLLTVGYLWLWWRAWTALWQPAIEADAPAAKPAES